jgi:hypothetical protein
MGIVVFNNLPVPIKRLYDNPTAFKRVLKKFLSDHSFYTLDEYFNYIWLYSILVCMACGGEEDYGYEYEYVCFLLLLLLISLFNS